MTNEQREDVDKLRERFEPDKFGGICALGYKNKYCFGKSDLQAIDTVLSLIKEQQEKMDKKDKQIDLMAEFMYKTGTGRRALSCMFRQNDECNENGCIYCIKRYFADKAKIEQ